MRFALCFRWLAAAFLIATTAAQAMPAPQPPEVPARSHILLDFDSDQVLAENNADARVEPASITKLMTAYIVFSEIEKGNLSLETPVTISEKAWRMGGSRMFVEVGKQVPAGDLIQGMIVQSGNDATVALAEHIAGNETAFADYMNTVAKELHMKNSHFMNASGWPDKEHYSTARDIALLGQALIRNYPQHYKFYSQPDFKYNGITQPNRNMLLGREAGVDGMKTGFTDSAGYCLVTSGKRGEMRLISVVLGTKTVKQRFEYSAALLNYGFRFFETRKLFDGATPSEKVAIWKGETKVLPVGPNQPVFITTQRGQAEAVTIKTELPPQILAPVTAGAPLGQMVISLDGKVLKQTPVVALQAVASGSWWRRLLDEARLRWSN